MLALLAASLLSQSDLVGGAPVKSPDVAVHVVEKKDYSDRGHAELTLYPAAVQVNGKFTQHLGAALGFTYHLHENFAVMAMGMWNYVNAESSFNTELSNKVNVEAASASSLLMSGGALVGVEVTPFYGKFALFQNRLVHFSIVLNGGAGAGSTRHQLKPSNAAGPATYGDTGWRFMAEVGGGFRVKFADWFSVRLEMRDVLYSATVSQVNGCNRADLAAMNLASNGGMNNANVSAGCNDSRFRDPDGTYSTDVPLANALVRNPSSDVLNNLGFYAGVSLDL